MPNQFFVVFITTIIIFMTVSTVDCSENYTIIVDSRKNFYDADCDFHLLGYQEINLQASIQLLSRRLLRQQCCASSSTTTFIFFLLFCRTYSFFVKPTRLSHQYHKLFFSNLSLYLVFNVMCKLSSNSIFLQDRTHFYIPGQSLPNYLNSSLPLILLYCMWIMI